MRFNPARLAGAALMLCWLLLLATACAAMASLWWLFELFVHFRVQYVLAGLVLAGALWVLGRQRYALLAAALAAINAAAVLPLLFASAQASTVAAGESLHVLSVNVFGRNRDYGRVFDYVRAEKPDVLVLIEITPAWARAIEQIRSEYAYAWIVPTGERAGMAVLTREPPLATQEIDLGGTGEPSLLLTLSNGEVPVGVLGTHLYWPLGARAFEVRNRQLARLARLAAEHRGPLLVTGDLNSTQFSPFFAALLRDGSLHNCGEGIEPTWPARVPFLFIQIDHCLATRDLAVQEFHGGPFLGSDHYPISMRVRGAPAAAR